MYKFIWYIPLILTVDCGSLTDPANGQVTHVTGTDLGQTAHYSCNTGYNLVGNSTLVCQATGNWSGSAPTCEGMLLHSVYLWSFCEHSENSSKTIFGPWCFSVAGWQTSICVNIYLLFLPIALYSTVVLASKSCHTHSLLMRLAELIVLLKNEEKLLEVSSCDMSPASMCSVCLWAFHEVRWVMALIGNAKQAENKWSSWNWTKRTVVVRTNFSTCNVAKYYYTYIQRTVNWGIQL